MHACCAMVASVVVLASGVSASGEAARSLRDATHRALEKPITVSFEDARMEDVAEFVGTFAGVTVRGMWVDERHAVGLEQDRRVSVNIVDGTVLDLLEDALEAASDGFEESTWQVSARGELQIGPRSRLNRYIETVIYDVNDLLMTLPDFTDVPEVDIDAAMQQGRSGGGGGSIFDGGESESSPDLGKQKDLAEELTLLVYDLVEPEQWQIHGGDGGLIRIHEGNLVIRAPEYIHRQLRGVRADLER